MKHITESDVKRYYSHTLQGKEEIALLNHVAQCDFCAGRLASAFPETELLTPPADLYHSILRSAKRIPSQRQKQWEFYRYSTKVILSMGMALSLLVFCNFPAGIFPFSPIDTSFLTQHFSIENGPKSTFLCQSKKQDDKEAYEESLQRKNEENKAAQEEFLQEKQTQAEKWKEKQENSGKLSAGLKKFLSSIDEKLVQQNSDN